MNNTTQQKGLFLVAALFGITVVLIIGTTVAALVLDRVEIRQDLDESGIAFYAADSGIEKALRVNTCAQLPIEAERTTCLDNEIDTPPANWDDWDCSGDDYLPFTCVANMFAEINTMTDEREVGYGSETAEFTLEVVTGGTCQTPYCVVSTGSFREARRTIEAEAPVRCYAPLDVMLVMDRSSSMNDIAISPDPQPFKDIKDTAIEFVGTILSNRDQAGVVWYSSEPGDGPGEDEEHEQNLTFDLALVQTKLDAGTVNINGHTDMSYGIERAVELMQHGARPIGDSKRVLIILADGEANRPEDSSSPPDPDYAENLAIQRAEEAKGPGNEIEIFGIGYTESLAADPEMLNKVVTNPKDPPYPPDPGGSFSDHYFDAPDKETLREVYLNIIQDACTSP